MYKRSASTVDVAIVDGNRVVLIKRKHDPFQGKWAFPGGFVDYGEPVEMTAVREIMEETGLEIELVDILGIYSAPDRDPRYHTITTVFIARPIKGDPTGGDDAEEAEYFPLDDMPEIAFSTHQRMVDVILAETKTQS